MISDGNPLYSRPNKNLGNGGEEVDDNPYDTVFNT